ncbi:hypothetical protein [Paenibacillus gansuensis]|uniref:Transposase n=1 Tax=Paenibacillus gansuensis TaxID=306542 RepID=A0ABW5PII8_9BACL
MKDPAKPVFLDLFENSFSVQIPVIETNLVTDLWAAHRSIVCPRNRIEGEYCDGEIKKFYRSAPQILRCPCCGILINDNGFEKLYEKEKREIGQ